MIQFRYSYSHKPPIRSNSPDYHYFELEEFGADVTDFVALLSEQYPVTTVMLFKPDSDLSKKIVLFTGRRMHIPARQIKTITTKLVVTYDEAGKPCERAMGRAGQTKHNIPACDVSQTLSMITYNFDDSGKPQSKETEGFETLAEADKLDFLGRRVGERTERSEAFTDEAVFAPLERFFAAPQAFPGKHLFKAIPQPV